MPVYKNKEKGTWFAKFNYKDWQGVTRQKKREGFRTQREAKLFEREFLAKANADVNMSFKSLVELYLEHIKNRVQPTTLDNKKYIIECQLLPYLENLPINMIDVNTISKWQNELISKNYKQTYLKTINNQLSTIFNFAVKYYNLSSNPVRLCGSMGSKNADNMDFWTTEEFNKFIAAVEDKIASKVIFEILFWTGIRSGELLALTLNDINFEAKTISINKNYARLAGEDLILPPKTPKSKRIIKIPTFLLTLIKEYTSRIYDCKSDERLFFVTKHYLQHEMKRGCEISGVKKIRIHDLRHSHASLLIEMGYSPLLISERLGHENIETTLQTYSHLYPNKDDEVAEKLEELNKMYA